MTASNARPSTRQDILEILKRRGSQTVEDLASAVGITPMGVRQHLAILEKDGLVSASSVRRGMGRPSYLYSLTERALELFPRNYQGFARSLLADIAAHEGPSMVTELFARRAGRLEQSYQERLRGLGLREKVAELARLLETNGNMADWQELNPDTFVLHEHNCGILGVAREFPEACRQELALFERVLQADVERLDAQSEGAHQCQYLIRRRANKNRAPEDGAS